MADGLQDASRYAGQVVRRVLLRRNIAIDAETAQPSPTPSRPHSAPVRPPGRRAGAGVFAGCAPRSDLAGAGFLPPAAGRWSTWRSR